MSLPQGNIAIIGAGLAGTAFALALHQNGIASELFESRLPDSPEISSGVILTPNGLRVLDSLGVFKRITDRSWHATHRTFKNDRDETTKKTLVTNVSMYGYDNHRLWRRLLLAELKTMLQERSIPIHYSSRFEGITSDTENEVNFLINGTAHKTSLLIGTDGIFSSVRKHLHPNINPMYTGILGCLAHIPRNTINWPYQDYEPAFTILGKPGGMFTMPEDPEAKDIMVGMQVQTPEQTRSDWDALSADTEKLCDFFRKGYDYWPENSTARQLIDRVCEYKDFYLWPFLKMPTLDSWFNSTGSVIILGDAAHAVPPSSGQGVNQALEDVQSLMLFLKSGRPRVEALVKWQEMRQQRVDAVYDYAVNGVSVNRMSAEEKERWEKEHGGAGVNVDDMRWLYAYDVEREVEKVLSGN